MDGSDPTFRMSSLQAAGLGNAAEPEPKAIDRNTSFGVVANPLTAAAPLTTTTLASHNVDTTATTTTNKSRSATTVSNQFANPVSGNFQFERVKQPLFVSFNDLNLYLKKNDAKVLDNVFGVIRPFHLTALMGPSGAGKTTLLALLRGQAHYARITGTMRVNGNSVSSLVPYREQMAFVPQDDILYEQLSVEDNILFSAILFNKRGYRKPSELLPMVYYAEEVLGIAFIRNSIVGSPEKKGN
jgi:ABC-type transport system involved in cytochrome bd biosynthesis fused ATPase/permease subunit